MKKRMTILKLLTVLPVVIVVLALNYINVTISPLRTSIWVADYKMILGSPRLRQNLSEEFLDKVAKESNDAFSRAMKNPKCKQLADQIRNSDYVEVKTYSQTPMPTAFYWPQQARKVYENLYYYHPVLYDLLPFIFSRDEKDIDVPYQISSMRYDVTHECITRSRQFTKFKDVNAYITESTRTIGTITPVVYKDSLGARCRAYLISNPTYAYIAADRHDLKIQKRLMGMNTFVLYYLDELYSGYRLESNRAVKSAFRPSRYDKEMWDITAKRFDALKSY